MKLTPKRIAVIICAMWYLAAIVSFVIAALCFNGTLESMNGKLHLWAGIAAVCIGTVVVIAAVKKSKEDAGK